MQQSTAIANDAGGNDNDDNDYGGVDGNCEMTTMVMTMIALTTTVLLMAMPQLKFYDNDDDNNCDDDGNAY